MALSFRRNGDGSFGVTVPAQERQLLEQLVPQMRELIEEGDSLTWRLFPNPYPDHEKAAAEYQELIGDELRQKHLASLDTISQTLSEKRLTEDQLVSWMQAVNDLRLVIGTRLEVTEDSDLDDFIGDTERSLFITYLYLGEMLFEIVRAISGE